jgi:hypothetical protein
MLSRTIKWICDVQQSSYWTRAVATYGASVLQPWPLSIGMKFEDYGTDIAWERTLREWVDPDPSPRIDIPSWQEDQNQRARRIRKGLRICQALEDGLRSSDNDLAERTASISGRQWERARVGGKNWKHPVLNPHKENKYFDPDQEKPRDYDSMRERLIDAYDALALATMINWTPANTVLAYINRVMIPGNKFGRDQWYEFLEYCQGHHLLFRFKVKGHGEMRRINDGWPEGTAGRREQPAMAEPPHTNVVRKIFRERRRRIILDALRDYSYTYLWERFSDELRHYTLDNPEEHLVMPMYNITQPEFHQVMLYFNSIPTLWV